MIVDIAEISIFTYLLYMFYFQNNWLPKSDMYKL
jgi:hypothetical protein